MVPLLFSTDFPSLDSTQSGPRRGTLEATPVRLVSNPGDVRFDWTGTMDERHLVVSDSEDACK